MSPSPAQVILLASGKEIKRLYAASFAGTARFATAAGGGEPGLSGGFGVVFLASLRKPQAIVGPFVSRWTSVGTYAPPAGTLGWGSVSGPGSYGYMNRNFGIVQGSGAWVYTNAVNLGATDIGRLSVFLVQYTGSALRTLADREWMAPVAASGLTESSGGTVFGNHTDGSQPVNLDFVDAATWGGTPTDANLIALLDAIRTSGRIPTSPTGITFRHRWSVPEALGAASVTVGSAAPALEDLVTGLSIDRADPAGAGPTVQEIHISGDGRSTYGFGGFSTLAYLQTSAANGIVGSASGFHAIGEWTLGGAALVGNHALAHCLGYSATPRPGWILQMESGVLRFYAYNTSGVATSVSHTLSAADLHWPMWIGVQLTAGGVLRMFVRGVQVGGDVAMVGTYFPATGFATSVGYFQPGNPVPLDGVFWGLTAGNDVTTTEILQSYRDYQTSGYVSAVPGKATRLYQPTLDVSSGGGVYGAIAQVSDRIGSAHLLRSAIPTIDTASFSYGLRAATNPYVYQVVKSPAATRTNGIYVGVLVYTRTGTVGQIVETQNFGVTQGWQFGINGTTPYLNFGTGAAYDGFSSNSAPYGWHHIAFRLTTAGSLTLFIDGALIFTLSSKAFIADTSGILRIGAGGPTTLLSVDIGTGADLYSDAQVASVWNTANTLPATAKRLGIGSKVQNLWNVYDDVLIDDNKYPIALRDRIGFDSAVAKTPTLLVHERKTRRWTYETTPTAYAADSLSDANYYSYAANIMPGSTTGFWATISLSYVSGLSAANRLLVSAASWDIRCDGATPSIYATMVDSGGTFRTTDLCPIPVGGASKIFVVTVVYDAAALKYRLYFRRTEVGTGIAVAGFTPNTSGTVTIGRWNGGTGFGAVGVQIYGLTYGHGTPTPGMIAAQHDAVNARDGQMVAIPGMTGHLYDATHDKTLNSGGSAPNFLDRVGVHHLTKVGSPVYYSRYARTTTV